MLSPSEFETRYPSEKLVDELPDKPISSVRDVQYLYGKLYTLATTGGGEYASYLTPDAARDFVDEDESLVVVRVDLSGNEPRLAPEDDGGPVLSTRYTNNHIPKVAHCKYPAARGIDHSVTHQAGKNSEPEKIARYGKERLSKWASDDVVQSVATDHEDGWIIDAVATLGEDENALETIEEAVTSQLDGSISALMTVQVKLEPDGEYLWPGDSDLDVFMAAMRRRKLSKLVSKGQASDSSGDATDLVTGDRTRTVGTAEDPLNYFLGKQLEKFPGLDPDEAWRNHPISEDAAVTLMNAETFVDACSYRTFGAKVYYLPYSFGVPDPEEIHNLYRVLYNVTTESGSSERFTPIESAYQFIRSQSSENGRPSDARLRFYVSTVMPHQMSRYDVFGETMNGRIQYPASLELSHQAILQTAAFVDDDNRTAALPTHENWSLLSGESFLGAIASGSYFFQTFPKGDDTGASADDRRIQALVAIFSGEAIPISMLLEAYVERIVEENGDDENGFPSFLITTQYAQLCALASADHNFLEASDNDPRRPITRPPNYDQPMKSREQRTIADGGFSGMEKLESFIKNTPALAPKDSASSEKNSVNDQRRAAFLLGALVGEVGSYQGYSENRSTTLIDQFPVKSITRNRVKKVAQEAIEKTLTYTRSENRTITLFEHIVERLRESILRPDPDDWKIETEDLRFYYALGVTYGMNDRPIISDADDDIDDTDNKLEVPTN